MTDRWYQGFDNPHAGKRILAVESSCDETAAAVVEDFNIVKSSIVSSQADIHRRYGGVVPEVASRRHLEMVDEVIAIALEEADVTGLEIDAIAVTRGPGLIGALLVGLAAAKSRAWAWQKPLVPVDHLLGHVSSVFLAEDSLEPPFLCLLASGGHTMTLAVEEGLSTRLIGSTRDDAAGEAFDKGARMLGFANGGGVAIEQAAINGDATRYSFTPAMVGNPSPDTSFSGIKTALVQTIKQESTPLTEQTIADLAAGFQAGIVYTISAMVRKAIKAESANEWNGVAIVGGVAANAGLRAEMSAICSRYDLKMAAAPLKYCGDNAAMIGVAASACAAVTGHDLKIADAQATSNIFRYGRMVPKECM